MLSGEFDAVEICDGAHRQRRCGLESAAQRACASRRLKAERSPALAAVSAGSAFLISNPRRIKKRLERTAARPKSRCGADGPGVIGHGSSKARSVMGALRWPTRQPATTLRNLHRPQ